MSFRIIQVMVFIVATLLRLQLCWVNPPDNNFDDHYEPISLIINTGEIPAKNACHQCYHPPVFYYTSALLVKALESFSITASTITKSLQFLNCIYNILTLLVIYLILKKLHLSEISKTIAFSIICFLPRHVFMSAIHSNDSLAYLGVSLCAYLLLIVIERNSSLPIACVLGAIVTLTIFVKYTTLLLLPMVAIPLASLLFIKSDIPRSKSFTALVIVMLLPLMLLGSYMFNNYRDYGQILPYNDTIFSATDTQPRDPEVVSFVSFTPWQFINEPIIIPDQMHSFWTLIYSSIWIDSEPKFTYFTDVNNDWWKQYYNWLNNSLGFPQASIPISKSTRLITAGLLICGLVPLGLLLAGLTNCLLTFFSVNSQSPRDVFSYQIFVVILLFNAFGIMLFAYKVPVSSSMKASYFLNSLPSFSVLIALGHQYFEKKIWLCKLINMVCCLVISLSFIYIIRIVWALKSYFHS